MDIITQSLIPRQYIQQPLIQIDCVTRYGYYLFTLSLPTEFPIGTVFPFNDKLYRVINHSFKYIRPEEAKELNPIVDLVLVVQRIEESKWHKIWSKDKAIRSE